MSIERIHGGNFVDEEVRLDGKHYVHCVFTRCAFLYDGGEFDIEDPMRMENCSLKLGGAAFHTLELLRRFGFIKLGEMNLILPE
jgi:hypothetical protein